MAQFRDYKYGVINSADASAGVTLVAAQTNPDLEIRVVHYTLTVAGAVSVTFRSGATPITGPMPQGAAGSGLSPTATGDSSLFETVAGQALVLLSSGAVGVYGHFTYYLAKD